MKLYKRLLIKGHKGHEYKVVVPQVVPQISYYNSTTYILGAQGAHLFITLYKNRYIVYI